MKFYVLFVFFSFLKLNLFKLNKIILFLLKIWLESEDRKFLQLLEIDSDCNYNKKSNQRLNFGFLYINSCDDGKLSHDTSQSSSSSSSASSAASSSLSSSSSSFYFFKLFKNFSLFKLFLFYKFLNMLILVFKY